MNPTPLAELQKFKPVTVAKLQGLKTIIRVETPRLLKWFLVVPATGHRDAVCVLLHKCSNVQPMWSISQCEPKILADYADRVIA